MFTGIYKTPKWIQCEIPRKREFCIILWQHKSSQAKLRFWETQINGNLVNFETWKSYIFRVNSTWFQASGAVKVPVFARLRSSSNHVTEVSGTKGWWHLHAEVVMQMTYTLWVMLLYTSLQWNSYSIEQSYVYNTCEASYSNGSICDWQLYRSREASYSNRSICDWQLYRSPYGHLPEAFPALRQTPDAFICCRLEEVWSRPMCLILP